MPSWVAFTDEECLVGEAAKDQFANNPHRTIFDIVISIFYCRVCRLVTDSAETSRWPTLQRQVPTGSY
jgi:molecular chaperone DnaK (HSP70)